MLCWKLREKNSSFELYRNMYLIFLPPTRHSGFVLSPSRTLHCIGLHWKLTLKFKLNCLNSLNAEWVSECEKCSVVNCGHTHKNHTHKYVNFILHQHSSTAASIHQFMDFIYKKKLCCFVFDPKYQNENDARARAHKNVAAIYQLEMFIQFSKIEIYCTS